MRLSTMQKIVNLTLGVACMGMIIFSASSSNAAQKEILQPKTLILTPEALHPANFKDKTNKSGKSPELKNITSEVSLLKKKPSEASLEVKQRPLKKINPKLELIVKPEKVKAPSTEKKAVFTPKTVLQKPEAKTPPVLKVVLNMPKKLPVKETIVQKKDKQVIKTKSKEAIKKIPVKKEVKKEPAPSTLIAEAKPDSKLEDKKEAGPEITVVPETKEINIAAESVLDNKDVSSESAVTVAETPKVTTVAVNTTLSPPSPLTFIPAEEKREVQIVVGESKVISAIGLIRTAVGNPLIADVVVVSNHELLVNGKTPGTTTLTLWDKRGRLTYIVTVLREPLSTKTRIFPLQYMWLKKYDVKTGDGKVTWTVSTNATLMGEIDKSLSLGISKDSYSINTELNNIVVQGTEKDIQKAEMIIGSLDVPPQQILIETRVLEVTDDDSKTMGISWNMNKEKVAIQFDTSGGQFKIDTLGALSEQYIAKVNALQEAGKANLLANPKISAVLHRDPGFVFLGDSIPVVTTTKDSTGASLQSVSYVEVGVNLFFLPTSISADGYVTMFVHTVSTSVSGFTSAGYPMFKGKSARSELRIKDGEAVVMGGLLRSDETEVLQKVPYLSELPFLGNFFKNKKKTKKNSEMIVIFIPHVLRNAETLPSAPLKPFNKN